MVQDITAGHLRAAAPARPLTRVVRQLGTDTGYALLGLVQAIVSFVLIVTLVAVGAGTSLITVGLPILVLGLLIARGFGDLHRIGVRAVTGRAAPRPYYPKAPEGAGPIRRLVHPITLGQSWLDVAAAAADLPFAVVAFVVTVVWWTLGLGGITYAAWDWTVPRIPITHHGQVRHESIAEIIGLGPSAYARVGLSTALGVFFLLTLPVMVRAVARARASVARSLLCGVAELRSQIAGLQEQKQAAASAEATALRRLERDIHDGPQQRLVRLAMDLGRARSQLDTDPDAARTTIEEALGQTRETLDELRALSRGIAPPILTDRGLPSAITALAGRCPIPIDLAIDPGIGRLDAGVESTAYFVTAESLTNIAKHASASRCAVTIVHAAGMLGVVIADDGVGGASIAKGHGLAGLTDRVRAAGGTLSVTSPTGGPTEIRAELPVPGETQGRRG